MYIKKNFSLLKRAISLFVAFSVAALSLPVMIAFAQVTSTAYEVEANAIKKVFPETLVCDFLDRIEFDGDKKLFRSGEQVISGYVKEGDVFVAGDSEYTVSIKNTLLYNPTDKIKDVADSTVLYEKPLANTPSTTPMPDYGFPNCACNNPDNYKNKTLKVVKGSSNNVPYYEISTNSNEPYYFYGTKLANYVNTENIGKYIVLEATILPMTKGIYGFSNYFTGNKGNKQVHTYFSKSENMSFFLGTDNKYGLGGYIVSGNTFPVNKYGEYTTNSPLTYKMYFKITEKPATTLELSELLVNGAKVKGVTNYTTNDGTSINYILNTLVGIASAENGTEAKARYSNIKTYIADTYPSVGNEASVSLKEGADYNVSQSSVSEIPFGTTVLQLLSSLDVAEKATAKIVNSSNAEVSGQTPVDDSMILKVISGNGKNEKEYTLSILEAVSEIDAKIEGEAKAGNTLIASFTTQNSDYENCDVTYKWLICDSQNGDYEAISGKTEQTLFLGDSYYGKYIKVEITPYIDSEPKVADTSLPIGPVIDEKRDFKEDINTATAENIEEKLSAGAEKFSAIAEIKAPLDEYEFRLTALNMLKKIPYSEFDDIVNAFSDAADGVKTAFGDETPITLEGVSSNEGTILSTHIDNTPAANIFTYGGKEFIVIDNDENEMYVITKDYCGKKVANTNEVGVYDALDEASIAYFLNRQFVTEGNGGYILPAGIVNYINYDKIWVSEPQSGTVATKTIGGIGLLSVTEYREYASRIGDDTIPEGAVMYYLRSPNSEYANHMLGLSLRELNGASTRGSFIGSRANAARQLRPVFYLDKTFFEKNKIESVGSDVAIRIGQICSREKLTQLYTQAEYDTVFKKPVIPNAQISGRPIAGHTLTAEYVYTSEFNEKNTSFVWKIAETKNGAYTPIGGKTEKTLHIEDEYLGKFIKVEITPKSEFVLNPTGDTFTTQPTTCAVMTQAAADSAAAALDGVEAENIHSYLTANDDIFQTTLMESDIDIRNLAITYLAQSDFTTMTEFEQDMNTCITMAKIRAGAQNEVEEIITTTQSSINMKNYTELEDKSSVNSYIKATAFTSAEDFIKKVDEKVGVAYFNNATRDDINSVLLRLDDMIIKDISALSDTQLTTLGLGVLTIDSYSDMSAVNIKINELYPSTSESVPEVTPPVSGSDNSSGGGGGGGGGGGAGSSAGITTPSTNQPQQNNASSLFSDMAGYEWANTAVNKLVGKGIINGMGDGRFAPADTLTREQFIKMIVTAFNLKSSGKNNPFSDVGDGHWSCDYILAAYENGITTGINETQFGVGTSLSKEQMVTFIYRALEKSGINIKAQGSSVVKDKDTVSEYATDAVAKLSSMGIVSGDENGYFNPSQTATRAMAAVVIYKTLENAEVSK